MMKFHVDRFSTLDDLPRKLKGEDLLRAALAVLRRTPRYSVWEMGSGRVRSIVRELKAKGMIRDKGGDFPWTEVEVVGVEHLRGAVERLRRKR